MSSADGKSSPFNSDGKSGATGNGGGGKFSGLDGHRGVDRPQKMGPPAFNADSVAEGGRVLKLDPPGDRQGLIGQTASGMKGKGPMKLGGKGPAMSPKNGTTEGTADAQVGDLPTADEE